MTLVNCRRLIFTALWFGAALAAQAPPTVEDGVELYDSGHFEEAAELFAKILESDPGNSVALYELALTQWQLGELDNCVALARRGLELDSETEAEFYTIGGTCLSVAEKPQKAVSMYRKGLARHPDHLQLNYNIAVPLAKLGKQEEAKGHLEKAIEVAPLHPGSHFLLANAHEIEGSRIPALLGYLRFMTLERASWRSEYASNAIVRLVNRGVEAEADGTISITLPSTPPDQENVFMGAELMLSMAAIGAAEEGEEDKSEAEVVLEALTLLLSFLEESTEPTLRAQFVWTSAVQPLFRLKQSGRIEAHIASVLEEAKLAGAGELVARYPYSAEELVRSAAD